MNEAAQYTSRPTGTRNAELTPERIAKICRLTKNGEINGKAIMDRELIVRELGDKTDLYFQFLCGGNGVAISLIRIFGWWSE